MVKLQKFLFALPILCLNFLLLPVNAAHLSAEPPGEIRLQLHPQFGFGEFLASSGVLSALEESNPWLKSYPEIVSLPEQLRDRDVRVLYIVHDNAQHAWQSYKTGSLDSTFVQDALNAWGVHPDRLTDQPLQLITVLLTWEDEAGESYVMYSDTEPYNFEDAEVFQVPSYSLANNEGQPLPLPVTFELYREGRVHTMNNVIRVNSPSDFNLPGFEGPVLLDGYYQHYTGTFELGGESWELALHNHFMKAFYGEKHDVVQVRNPNESWSEPANPGQFVHLGERAYQFIEASFDGSEVLLRYVPDFDELRGTQPGMRALDFKQESITGELISIDDQLGKWVFLDFWGTWCGPCIAEMPYLKEAWRLFGGDEFQFIGIANDSRETLNRFTEEWEITWPQLISNRSESNEMNELYGIRSWPTTFLLGPDGVIIDQSLRGFQLEEKLAAELGFDETRAERLREGRVLIEIPEELITLHLNGEDDSGAVRVQVQGNDLPFRSRIPLYRHNGAFVRGLDPAPGTDEVEVIILLNGERVDLPLPGRFKNEEGEIRYRFPVNN